jgi:hypothetical protein
MPVFNFELNRTYSTNFEIKAKTQRQAFKKFQKLGDDMYSEELQQCNVIAEVVLGDRYARSCNCCGEGMNEGYFVDYEYFCSKSCLSTEYPSDVWEKLYKESEANGGNDCYWTQWDDSEYEYQYMNGKLVSIKL